MKERPILFSAPMVRAIIAGKKTQTRRIVKFPAWMKDCDGGQGREIPMQFDGFQDTIPVTKAHVMGHCKCPYGVAGDRLWVRETWCRKLEYGRFIYDAEGNLDASCCHYAADGYHVAKDDGDGGTEYTKSGREASPWSPSIHMPRWASRITLEVVAVRVERLQEITDKDVFCEGIQQAVDDGLQGDGSARGTFIELWESINGPESWNANPWVWVVEFRSLYGGAA